MNWPSFDMGNTPRRTLMMGRTDAAYLYRLVVAQNVMGNAAEGRVGLEEALDYLRQSDPRDSTEKP